MLEAAVGVTDEDREFLRKSVITLEQLRSLDDHPLAKSTSWMKVSNARHLAERLKGRWTVILAELRANRASQNRTTDSQVSSSYLDSISERLQRTMQRSDDITRETQRARDEQHRREMDLHYRDLERARELEHVRKLAEIKGQDSEGKTRFESNDLPGSTPTVRGNSKLNYRSPWKRAIREALVVIGSDTSYQQIATWIAENITGLELPGYCVRALKKNERGDIGFLYRANKAVRDQFSKDVAKIKTDLRTPNKTSRQNVLDD